MDAIDKGKALDSMDEEFGLLTSKEVAKVTGYSPGRIIDLHAAGKLFAVVKDQRWLYPAFQFDPVTHTVFPVISELIETAEKHGRSESGLAVWMMERNEYLDGFRPVDCLNTPDTLRISAEASFKAQW